MTVPSLTCDPASYPARDCVADGPYATFLVDRHVDASRGQLPTRQVAFAPPAFRRQADAGAAAPAQPPLPPFLRAAGPTPATPGPGASVEDDCAGAVRESGPVSSRLPTEPPPQRPPHPMSERDAASLAIVLARLTPATATPEPEARQSGEIAHRIRRGETISSVLTAAGVSRAEVDEWLRATRRIYNLNRIYVGQSLTLTIDAGSGRLERLGLEIDAETRLVATRDADGTVQVREEAIPYGRRLRLVAGEITRNLYATAAAAGMPDKIVSDVAEILGWEVDFTTELQPGATFRVVYEELVRRDTMKTSPGRVLAVELTNRGNTHGGYYFADDDGGDAGYYDRSGEALGRAFLRYPVKFSRISSAFSRARFHPILKRNTPHHGVDFAAAPGTPVAAVADGAVTRAGWQGGYGRYVKVRHDGVYGSGYAHLSRIAAGIRPGVKVQKGQVIGYVGSSGRATGPHLHFEMYRQDRYIDPLNTELPRGRSLAGESLAAFRLAVALMDGAYAEMNSRYAAIEDADPTVTQVARIVR